MTSSTSMPKTSLRRWRTRRRWSGPWAPTSAPPVAGSWLTRRAPSPSASEASAPGELDAVALGGGGEDALQERGLRAVPGGGGVQLAAGGEAAGGEVVGLDGADDQPFGHLVEMVAVAGVGGGELPGGAPAERAAGGERLEGAQEQGLAEVLAVGAGEDDGHRRLAEAGLGLQPLAQGRGRRGLVAERLHDADDAVAVGGRADQRLDRPVLAQDPGADGVDLVARRLLVLDQLLEQGVVELGEVLEERRRAPHARGRAFRRGSR